MNLPSVLIRPNTVTRSKAFISTTVTLMAVVVFSGVHTIFVGSASAATATFGVTSVQSTPENLNYGYKMASQVTAPEAGSVSSLSYYIDGNASASGSGTLAAAIYSDETGEPGTLLGSSATQTIAAGTSGGWVSFVLTSPVTTTAGSNYWLSLSAGDKTVARVYRGTTTNAKVWARNGGVTPTSSFGTAYSASGPISAYATYDTVTAPITATFGNDTVQSTPENLNYGYKMASQVTAPEAGTIRSLAFYFDGNASATGSGTVAAAIYTDDAGKPGTLLGSSAALTVPAGQAAGWVTFDLATPVSTTAGSNYWLSLSAGDKTVARVYRGTTTNAKVWARNGGVTPTSSFGTAYSASGPISAYATYEPTPTPVKLMPLGDSITLGWNYYPGTSYPPPGGYRTLLWQKLVQQDGDNIDFVGSLSSGPDTLGDKDHEGHSGWRIDQIRANIDTYMANAQPDVVLLMIGTNDVLQNYDLANVPSRLQDLVGRICTDKPSTRIVVSTIAPRPGLDSRVNAYNAAVPGVVTTSQNSGCNTGYFDMNSYMTASDINTYDNTHPTMAGYDKMAEAWYPYVSNLYTEMTQ